MDLHIRIRTDWLDLVRENILEPARRIIDPHHHFFAQSEIFPHYMLDDLRADTRSHNVEQTVFLQCWESYRVEGPEALKPVGEAEWVAGIAAQAAQAPGATQIGAIVGTADLLLGARVREVLEAHLATTPLFRGIRYIAAWDASDEIPALPGVTGPNTYGDPKFREGFAVLAELGLSFDAYHYHPQTPYLTDLAHAFPDTTIVLDHLGTPLGIGPYAHKQDEIFAQWAHDLAALAACPNVSIKLGGLAMPWNGFGFETGARPPTSDALVTRQSRYRLVIAKSTLLRPHAIRAAAWARPRLLHEHSPSEHPPNNLPHGHTVVLRSTSDHTELWRCADATGK